MTSVAVVGVGDMGSEMIPHLIAARFNVTAYDINRERLKAAATDGATLADSPAGAAREADIILSLVMSADIESAHLGHYGILAGLRPGAVLVIGSTTTPEIVRDIKNKAPECLRHRRPDCRRRPVRQRKIRDVSCRWKSACGRQS
jgi:3-hydroxyisobutyrate dehydrogenase